MKYLFGLFALLAFIPFSQPSATSHYVSPTSRGGDGTSWVSAWRELNQVDWGRINPGDTLYLDGGAIECPPLGDEPENCGVVYHTQLAVLVNGVTIALASDPGHDGTAILDGGQASFTYCAANAPMPLPPASPSGTPLGTVLTFNGRSDVTLDGTKWGGIVIRNGTTYGINLGGGDSNTVRYVKVHHINNPGDTSNSSVGITMGPTADFIRLEHVELYRNGQDAIRAAADDFTLSGSYIHDHYCNHPDGIQGFVPTSNTGVGTAEQAIERPVIEGNVFSNIALQAIFYGERIAHQSWAEDVVIRDNLFLHSPFFIKSNHANTKGWLIEHNTFVESTNFAIEWCCTLPGAKAPMTIRANVFSGLRPGNTAFYLTTGGGNTAFQENCLWNSGSLSGQYTQTGTIRADPNFAPGSYTVDPNGPCAGKGSRLGNVEDLLPLPPTPTPTNTPSPTPTLEPTPSETPTLEPTPTGTPPPTTTPTLSGCWDLRGRIPVAIPCPID